MSARPAAGRWWLVPAALALLALAIRVVWIVGAPFDGLYGQDSFAHLDQVLATRAWVLGQGPAPVSFFWPLGFALTALPFTLLLGPSLVAIQIVTLVCGVAVVPLTWGVCRRVQPGGGRCAALLAAAVVAIAGQMVTSSVVVMSDMPALFWAALATWLVLEPQKRSGDPWKAAGAGAALGMAVITRWVYGVIVPAFVGWLVVEILRRRRPWWYAVVPGVTALVVVVPQVLISLHRPEGFVGHWIVDWKLGNALASSFDAGEGRLHFPLPNWLLYTQPAGSPRYMFPALAAMIPIGAWRLMRQRAYSALVLLVGWAGLAYLFLVGLPYQNLRYGLTMSLPLVVLSSVGACDLLDRRVWRGIAIAVILVSLGAMMWWSVRTTGDFLCQMNATKGLARDVERALPDGATLMCLGLTATLEHYTDVDAREFYNQDPSSLAAFVAAPAELYLLIVRPEVEWRWADEPPGRNLAWLEARTALREVRRFGPYTLYAIDESLPDRSGVQRQRE